MSGVLSRRAFLGAATATGAFVLGTRLVPLSVFSQDALAQGPGEPGVYLAILPDGLVQLTDAKLSGLAEGMAAETTRVAANASIVRMYNHCAIGQLVPRAESI